MLEPPWLCATETLISCLPSVKSAISIPIPSFIIIFFGVNSFLVVTTSLNSSGIKYPFNVTVKFVLINLSVFTDTSLASV